MLAIIFIGVLNWGHAVDRGRALELDALVYDTWSHRRILLEDALGRARVGIGVAWNLQRRKTLRSRARWRDWSARSNG